MDHFSARRRPIVRILPNGGSASHRVHASSRPARLVPLYRSLAILVLFFSSVPAAAAPAGPGSLLPEYAAHPPAIAGPTARRLDDFGAFSAGEGWLLMDGRLYRTRARARAGRHPPPELGASAIAAVHFLDPLRGWSVLLSADPDGSPLYWLARTADAGRTWRTTSLALFAPGEVAALAEAAYLRFLDFRPAGWSSSALGEQELRPGDPLPHRGRGRHLAARRIPIGDPVAFVDRRRGWTAGGAAGDQLYRTEDGGRTWRPEVLVAATDRRTLRSISCRPLPAMGVGSNRC